MLGACGESPVGPSDVKGLTLTNMSMTSGQMQGSAGVPPFTAPRPLHTLYSLCGSIRPSPGASEQITIRTWEVTIFNGDGSVLLTWTDPTQAGRMIGLGIFGCFGGPFDDVPNRAAGARYRFRLTYLGGGDNGVVESAGAIGRL